MSTPFLKDTIQQPQSFTMHIPSTLATLNRLTACRLLIFSQPLLPLSVLPFLPLTISFRFSIFDIRTYGNQNLISRLMFQSRNWFLRVRFLVILATLVCFLFSGYLKQRKSNSKIEARRLCERLRQGKIKLYEKMKIKIFIKDVTEKHLTIKNGDSTFLKNILRFTNLKDHLKSTTFRRYHNVNCIKIKFYKY